MITAKEANQLVDESGVELDNYLKTQVEPKIVEAANAGKRTVVIDLDCLGPFERLDQNITPLNLMVVARLSKLGYLARIDFYGDSYVPRGLADDDGNGPAHRNFGFIIGW